MVQRARHGQAGIGACSVLILGLLLWGTTSWATTPETLLVATAISLKEAFAEIGREYKRRSPGITVQFHLGASGLLQKQIEQGAPIDVFASAGQHQMDELQHKGLIVAKTRRDFARNAVVLVVKKRAHMGVGSFEDLLDGAVSHIAIGNPKTVPAGQYGRQVLQRLALWEQLQPKLVFAENVRQVLDYVTRGEVQVGMVYITDALIGKHEVEVAAHAPQGSHLPILYPIAVIKDTKSAAVAHAFVQLVLSPVGQAILEKHGFLPVF